MTNNVTTPKQVEIVKMDLLTVVPAAKRLVPRRRTTIVIVDITPDKRTGDHIYVR